jgi:hypothetical protein
MSPFRGIGISIKAALMSESAPKRRFDLPSLMASGLSALPAREPSLDGAVTIPVDLHITLVPGIGHIGMTVAPAGIDAVRKSFLSLTAPATG